MQSKYDFHYGWTDTGSAFKAMYRFVNTLGHLASPGTEMPLSLVTQYSGLFSSRVFLSWNFSSNDWKGRHLMHGVMSV